MTTDDASLTRTADRERRKDHIAGNIGQPVTRWVTGRFQTRKDFRLLPLASRPVSRLTPAATATVAGVRLAVVDEVVDLLAPASGDASGWGEGGPGVGRDCCVVASIVCVGP
jgi:hypothetical protein